MQPTTYINWDDAMIQAQVTGFSYHNIEIKTVDDQRLVIEPDIQTAALFLAQAVTDNHPDVKVLLIYSDSYWSFGAFRIVLDEDNDFTMEWESQNFEPPSIFFQLQEDFYRALELMVFN